MSSVDGERRVWDRPVRVTHWLLVVAVSGSWLTSKYSATRFALHEVCGYTTLVLVMFRVVWGFVGTRHARFAAFLRSPCATLAYLRATVAGRTGTTSVGHNPAGGWSVVALLALLLMQAAAGLFANDEIMHTGPLFGWVSISTSNQLTKLHHVGFRVLQLLVALHLVAIAYYRVVRHDDLVRPMLTGRKAAAAVPDGEEIGAERAWLAFVIIVCLSAALALAIHLAPEASLSIF